MTRPQNLLLILSAVCLLKHAWTASVGDTCKIESTPGICKRASDCLQLNEYIKRGDIELEGIQCGIATFENLICCPTTSFSKAWILKRLQPGLVWSVTEKSIKERPAEKACHLLEEKIIANPNIRVLGGASVELGEFPYMVGIGYKANDEQNTYDIRCGGTLIDAKFVLTTAYCITVSGKPPLIVRLGVINNTDVEEIKNGLEIPIKKIHVHPEYVSTAVYNDIGLLELENSVEFTSNIFPTCLYTNVQGPPADAVLYATGWGITSTTTRTPSDVLLKGVQELVPLDVCNSIISNLKRVKQTQICTRAKKSEKSPCRGDAGGPISLVVDPTWRIYRLVGVISVGYICGLPIPDVNTRVASYLDFIENIVWPYLK
ncbi:serine protease persephone-like [Teleopsis dalmanni]|uniref:serine protease persephone-like n=1 Tax=Teleopsis dalmanni TaxID=139649 RepID=UPI0018CCEB5A|nr:serine protease persephone-like [Teleopsis dalmanni]XP_037937125.1 serine protease persephone-like [Teleopsis dalmanni]